MRLIRTVVIGLVAFAPIMFGMMAANAQVPQSPAFQASASGGEAATAHGPFDVTAQDMAQRITPEWLNAINREAPNGGQAGEPDAQTSGLPTTSEMLVAMAGRLSDPDAPAPTQPTSAASLPEGPGRIDAVGGLPQSPSATTSLRASGLVWSQRPPDPTVAASATHLVVTGQAIAAYDKAGHVVIPTQSQYAFFYPVSKTLSDTLGVAGYFDTRSIYDSYRGRFWVTSLVQNDAHQFDTQRLTKVVVAVSKTDNPLDGWYLYWWDAVAHDGTGDGVDQLGYGGDYDSIGIDATAIYETNKVANALDSVHDYPRVYWHVSFFPAASLASGTFASGWQYWDLKNPPACGGDLTPAGVSAIQPAVHHGSAPRAYLISRCGTAQAVVWAITDPLAVGQTIQRVAVSLAPFQAPVAAPQPGTPIKIEMTNLGNDFLKAVYRDNLLYATGMDARTWLSPTDTSRYTSIRLVRLDVSAFPSVTVSIDRTFGGHAVDDPPGAHAYYGWPAMDVNKAGDMALVYARSGDVITPEIRYSAYFSSEVDIRPSRLLWPGAAPYTATSNVETPARWGDNAGASVDPFDDTAIWLAHQYPVPYIRGTNFGLAIGVSKVFGPTWPDWTVLGPPVVIHPFVVNCCAVVPPGGPVEIVATFYNQGDGAAPVSLANVFLSATQAAPQSDTLIGQMTVGALASGATLPVTQTFTVPLATVPGLYYVTVVANANHQFAEYSTTNDGRASAAPILVAHPGPWLPLILR
jgi:hypothetical protein